MNLNRPRDDEISNLVATLEGAAKSIYFTIPIYRVICRDAARVIRSLASHIAYPKED